MLGINFFQKRNDQTLLAIYDLEKINCSFDFLIFFQVAAMYKKKNNLKNIDLCLSMGSTNGFKSNQFKREDNFKLDRANLRLNYLIFQSINMYRKNFNNFYMLENKKDTDEILSKYRNVFPPNYKISINKNTYCGQCTWKNLEQNHEHVSLLNLEIPEVLCKNIIDKINTSKKIISITLREASFTPERNSLKEEWKKFILYLEEHNYFVIVIRDSEKFLANDEFSKYDILPFSAYDLNLKASIYKIAHFNYFVNSGPSVITWINNYKSARFKNWGSKENLDVNEKNFGLNKYEKSMVLNNDRNFLIPDLDTYSNLINFHENFFYN